jgi:hypothetical protein
MTLELFQGLVRITAATTIGVIAGWFPLNYASKKGRSTLAPISFLSCVALGLLGGLVLAIPASLIFITAIYFSEANQNTEESEIPKVLKTLSIYLIVSLWVRIFFAAWGNRMVHNIFQSIADFIFP